MKKSVLTFAILFSLTGLAKEACFQVTEAHYSESDIKILNIHEVVLTDASGEDFSIEDKNIVSQIIAKNTGKKSLEAGFEYSSIDEDLSEISVCLELKNSRTVSSNTELLLEEYSTTQIKNAQLTSIKVYKGKKYEKKHLPLADTLNDLNSLL